jgi:cytosine/adenosine deaminase-related metal-dependent hydrolase
MTDLLITGACAVTMDPQRRVLDDAAIAIEGSRIAAIGPAASIASRDRAAQCIDASGMLALPGLIDVHFHPNQYLASGIGDDVDIETWLFERIYPYEAALTAEEAYWSALGAYAEALRYGTTCFADPGGIHPDPTAQAALDSGIRGIVNRSTRDLFDPAAPIPEILREDTATNLREAERVLSAWHRAGDGRLRAWTSLRHVFDVSDELATGIAVLARRYGVGIQCHAAAFRGENEMLLAQFGKRPLMRLHDLGLFGPNLLLVHMGFPDEAEVALLRRHDVKVAHCPSASMLGGYGVLAAGMIPRMVAEGVTVALGTDAAAAGGHHDLVRTMYLAACAHKDVYADATVMGAQRALEMATINGARACLWEDEIGSLEAGKKADIALFAMDALDWHPGRDPVRNLVYSATGRSADTVIVDGRVLMREGVLLTIDQRHLRARLTQADSAWRARAGVTIPSPWPVA